MIWTMSYDLAVWEAVPPFTGRADEAFELLAERLEADDVDEPPTEAITEFVEALLAVWPELGEDEDEGSPWASGPLLGEACGPCIYFAMTYSGADDAVPVIARMAKERGLVCYDPQVEEAI